MNKMSDQRKFLIGFWVEYISNGVSATFWYIFYKGWEVEWCDSQVFIKRDDIVKGLNTKRKEKGTILFL